MSDDEDYDDDDEDEDYEEVEVQRKPAGSGRGTCLAIVLGGGALMVLLICCGGGGGLIWFGLNIVTAEIEDQLRDNERLKEHVGVVESFSLDFSRSAAKNDDSMVFQVKGSLGSGSVTVVADTDAEGHQVVRSAVLRLPDGKDVPLVP